MDRLIRILIYLLVHLAKHTKRLARFGIGKYEEWEPGKTLKILLVGYNGARNTGADVRTAAIARQLKQVYGPDKVQITVMALDAKSLRPYFDSDVKLFPFTTAYLLPLYRAASVNHVAVISEGSMLKGTFADALTLFFCEACGIMRSQHKPCIAYGVEAGQMDALLQKTSADLCRDTYFILRNQDSMKILRSLGLGGHVGTDAAWCYDGAISDEKAKRWLRDHGWDGQKPCIGVAVIDAFCWPVRSSLFKYLTGHTQDRYDKWYYFSRSEKRTQAQEHYIEEIAKAINRFSREENIFPLIIGMEKLDEAACKSLQAKLKLPCALLLSAKENADCITGVLRQMDMMVTSRYHAAVLSMDRAMPVLAISMDERLDSLLSDCSLAERYLAHTTDFELGQWLYEALRSAKAHRPQIKLALQGHKGQCQKELSLMGYFLKDYLKELLESPLEKKEERAYPSYIKNQRKVLPGRAKKTASQTKSF